MARTPKTAVAPVETPALDAEKVAEIQNTAAALIDSNNDERDTLNQMIGQIQMTGAIAKLTTVVGLTKLAHIKETRMYKALAGKKGVDRNGAEIADVGTWEGFCLAIGTTRQKADEDILNLKIFGEEALEDLGRIGAGYRDLRQFRRLPEDEKTALIEVAKAGDKEAFVELAEEIITKNAREKDALQQSLNNTMADYEAQAEVLSKKSQELDATKVELAQAQRRLKNMKPDEAELQLKTEISGVAIEIESLLKTQLDSALQTLTEHASVTGTDNRLFMAGLVRQMEMGLLALRDKYDLPDDTDTDFLSAEALEAASAAVAQMREKTGL
jgi:hypothetical protein